MKRLLDAVSQPNDLRLLRPALATDIIGVEAEKLDLMLDSEPGWENWLVAFKEYHEIWKKGALYRCSGISWVKKTC